MSRRGELVPTEAELARAEGRDYEPASVLLERIRREREAETKPAKPTRTRKATPAPAAAKLSRGAYLKRCAIAAYAVS